MIAICVGQHQLSLLEARRCTLYEFEMLQMAYRLKKEETRENMAWQAWYGLNVKATKGTGENVRSAYDTFSDFYDKSDEFMQALRPKPIEPTRKKSTSRLNAILNPKKT